MGAPLIVWVFAGLMVILFLLQWWMTKEVNDAHIAPKLPYFYRDSSFRNTTESKVLKLHEQLFATSWKRDIFQTLRITQMGLFVVIVIGIILSYTQHDSKPQQSDSAATQSAQ